jgi:hypothetical protein
MIKREQSLNGLGANRTSAMSSGSGRSVLRRAAIGSFCALAVLGMPVMAARSNTLDRAQAAPFVVVVNVENPVDSITVDQLSRMFLKKIRQWEGGRAIHLVEQRATAPVRKSFTERVHRRPASALAAYWQQQIFSGRAVPPPERSTDREIVDYVRATTDGIGYVTPGTALGAGVRTLRITP